MIQSIDLLIRRGLRPVAVLLDASSFGAFYSGESLAASLKAMGVSACQIKYGEDLSDALSATMRASMQMF